MNGPAAAHMALRERTNRSLAIRKSVFETRQFVQRLVDDGRNDAFNNIEALLVKACRARYDKFLNSDVLGGEDLTGMLRGGRGRLRGSYKENPSQGLVFLENLMKKTKEVCDQMENEMLH